MEKSTLIKVTNRYSGRVVYNLPDLRIRREFSPRETKELTFEELQALNYTNGGKELLKNYLIIKNIEAAKELLPEVEPEYFYEEEQIIKLLKEGDCDELLDCIDFAPDGVLLALKDLAVSLPLNDVTKRDIIKEKLNFDVTHAIEIQKAKFDGEEENASEETTTKKRRVGAEAQSTTKRRAKKAPEYKFVD